MNRRDSLGVLAAFAAAGALPARAQPQARLPRVTILFFGSQANFATRAEAFTKAMAQLGHVDRKTVAYEWRTANGQEDLLARYAGEIAAAAPAVVVSASTHTTRALKRAGVASPVVMAAVEDPVAEGFVHSLEKPGTAMTGISASAYDHLDRHIELLFAVAPRLTRVTALVNPDNPSARGYRGRLQSAVRAGTRLVFVNVSSPAQVESAFPSRARDDSDGLLVMNDVVLYNERRTITEAAARARRPAVYPQRGYVEAGGLMSYGPNPEGNFVQAASFVDRILKGAKPAELPLEPARRIELVVNREAMRSLDLQLPPELAKQAVPFGR